MKTLDERWRQANAAGDTASAELLAELMDAQTLINSDELDQAIDQLQSIRDQLYKHISSIEATLGGIE